MKTLPIVCDGKRIGEAEKESDRLYIRVNVRVASRRGLWCAWGIGERGETRIGILEPVNGESVISRRFSRRSLADTGEFSRVELRPANVPREAPKADVTPERVKEARTRTAERVAERHTAERVAERHTLEPVAERPAPENAEAWRRTGTARLFRSMRFQRQLRDVREALTRGDGERRKIALIREEDAPFPIPELFCLATPARIETRNYWVFTFDRQEWPVL